jgi:hypothetical protein
MKRVKMVDSGRRSISLTCRPKAGSIHGVGHGPSGASRRCMSRQRWTADRGGRGPWRWVPSLRSLSVILFIDLMTVAGRHVRLTIPDQLGTNKMGQTQVPYTDFLKGRRPASDRLEPCGRRLGWRCCRERHETIHPNFENGGGRTSVLLGLTQESHMHRVLITHHVCPNCQSVYNAPLQRREFPDPVSIVVRVCSELAIQWTTLRPFSKSGGLQKEER